MLFILKQSKQRISDFIKRKKYGIINNVFIIKQYRIFIISLVLPYQIKHIDENGVEFCYARELMKVLSYKDWRYFKAVIEKAKMTCHNTRITDDDHFVVDNKMVEIYFVV